MINFHRRCIITKGGRLGLGDGSPEQDQQGQEYP